MLPQSHFMQSQLLQLLDIPHFWPYQIIRFLTLPVPFRDEEKTLRP